MRSQLLFLILIFSQAPAYGQGEIHPDTLDWHGYYPLEVGNIWEWKLDNFYGDLLVRQHIESDTLIDNESWLLQTTHTEGIWFGQFLIESDSLFLRYDEPYRRILARTPTTGREYDYTCDLSGDFGEEVLCGAGLADSYTVVFFGQYANEQDGSSIVIAADTVQFAAYKRDFVTAGGVPPVYYHGIGRLEQPGDGFNGTIKFTYLSIGGMEYGNQASLVGTEGLHIPSENDIVLYPNPVSTVLTASLNKMQSPALLSVYDLQGRLVIKDVPCQGPCTIDVSTLSPNIYFVHAGFNQGAHVIRQFIVIR